MNPLKTLAAAALLFPVVLLGSPATPPEPETKEEPKTGGPKSVECRFLGGKIKFDGSATEAAWQAAQALDFSVPWEKRPPKTATTARLLWDKEYLYFAADMEDIDLYAQATEANGRTWEDDVFQLLFKPNHAKKFPLGFYEFHVTAANTPLQVFYPSRGGGGLKRFLGQTEVQIESVVKLKGTLNDWTDKDKSWAIEGRIPWTAFEPTGGRPRPGDRWRFALGRRDVSVYLEQVELSTCVPLTQPDLHRYEEWLELVFMDRK
jgi:hypothetical protein